ncbi:SDR family oxidoreductase [Salinarimonas ramus]|uniref:Oxidoreductase n=1 Tax=Salinarimonas ramus TaxID=690164 RepID=A0A917V467_9HYPH|nr:SDR family oxidoreductase [Salinarimonas ramus]GGK34114.1 oxidoreductase [Salinarimonas ramus]
MARIAVVTGAGSGIGLASALELARTGFDLVLAGRRPEPLEEAAARIRDLGREALCVPTDVADEAQVDALFARAVERFGRVDLLFNNAGLFTKGAEVDALSVADWKRSVDVNLTGAFLCARAAYIQMKRQDPSGGRIINNGSISAHTPRPGSAPYTATKHAITGLTKSLALDGRPHDIAVGQIDIGNAETEMIRGINAARAAEPGAPPPQPTMDVAHAARAVAHMASLPLDANVLFMTVMATKMPFVGRG